MSLTGDLRGEPLHDMERGFDELNGHLHQHRHAQTARADARQQQPANHAITIITSSTCEAKKLQDDERGIRITRRSKRRRRRWRRGGRGRRRGGPTATPAACTHHRNTCSSPIGVLNRTTSFRYIYYGGSSVKAKKAQHVFSVLKKTSRLLPRQGTEAAVAD